MIARFDGECADCDGAIHAGRDEITRDAKGRWVHANDEDCDRRVQADEFLGLPPKPVCRVCRCVMPCWCDDGGQPEDAAKVALDRAKARAARDPFDGFL